MSAEAFRAAADGRERGILPPPAFFAATFAVTAVAWSAALWLWSTGQRPFAVSAFALGLSLGPCLTAYATVPRSIKQLQRRVVLAAGAASILAPGLLGAGSLDLEGFFLLLLAGTGGAALGHTLVTVIAGPLVFGRALCGWGCWRAAVLELLPARRGRGRRRGGAWRLLPYAGLAASAAAVAFAFHRLAHRPPETTAAVLVAVAAYYAVSVGFAFALRDPRAFCKYLCPSGAILRVTSRPARLRIAALPGACDDCGACARACPMDVDVAALARGRPGFGAGECVLCQRCVQACPRDALHLTFARRPRAA